MVQPRKEGAVLEGLGDERIHLLLERQLDVDADGAAQSRGIGGVRAFVRRLHEAGAAAGEDVAAHAGELRGELLHAFVGGRAGLEARGAEDGHAIVLPRGAAQAGEVVDDFPQSADGAFEDATVASSSLSLTMSVCPKVGVLMLWLGEFRRAVECRVH